MKQGFVEYFQDLNLEPTRVEDHRNFDPEDLYHERVNIIDKLIEQIIT